MAESIAAANCRGNREISRVRTALLAVAFCVACMPPAVAATRRVALIYDERTDLPGLSRLDSSLTRTLSDSREPVEVYRESLDLSRFHSPDYLPRVRAYLRAKYREKPIDVAVAVMAPSLEFLLGSGDAVFPGATVVFCGIDRRELGGRVLPANVTGVLVKREFAPTLDLALRLHAGTQRVVFVAGTSAFDQSLTGQARDELRRYERRLAFTYLIDLPLSELLQRLAHLEPHTVVLYSTLFRDGTGAPFVPHEVAERVSAAANAPVYGFVDQYLGRGIVGGHLYSLDAHGNEAGRLVLRRILSGVPPGTPPFIEPRASVDQFDGRQLRRWGIDEALLPAGGVVLYREKTIWSEHRGKILGGLALFLAQAGLIFALLVARRNRTRAERRVLDSEARYRTLADFTHDWEYWRRPDGSFEYMTPSCLRITGHGADAFYRKPSLLDEIVVEEDRPRWTAHQTQADTGTGSLRLELRVRAADGRVLWIDHVCSPVKAEDGRLLGRRGSNRDITEKKLAETQLRRAVGEIERLRERLEADNTYLREQTEPPAGLAGMIGRSKALQDVVARVRQVAPTSTTVLLQGETGVGKELVAHAVHGLSPRAARPLIKINCAALPASLIESELFGHEKGAFTGAVALRKGRFEIADGSTLLLDEIGELPLELQAKLLRVLQDGQFERVGGTATRQTDVRLVAATNRRLEKEVAAGRFREDLWYRLNVFPITVPPLRQRSEDIPMLVHHFVEKHCRQLGRPLLEISQGTMRDLQSHNWPGNVRELESVVERAVISSPGPALRLIDPVMPGRSSGRPPDDRSGHTVVTVSSSATRAIGRTLEEMERDHIAATLEQCCWRVEGPGGAAAVLGMNSSTLRSRMRKLGIRRASVRSSSVPPIQEA